MAQWRSISGFVVLLAVAACSSLFAEDKPAEDKDKASVAKLIAQLGSDDLDERDDAEAALRKLGPKAIDAVRKAGDHADAEIRRRARKLAAVIEYQIIADSLLAPKKVRLKLDDVTVSEALAQLGKQTGYQIEVDTDAAAKRKVTLNTGEVTLNEGLDALCKKAQLVQTRVASGKKAKRTSRESVGPESTEPELIVLRDGVLPDGPAVYVGSVRLRVLPLARTKKDNLFALPIEAVAEPRLREFRVVRVMIDKAVDDQGQTLDVVADYEDDSKKSRSSISINGRVFRPRPPAIEDRTAPAALKKGEKSAKSLRELKGHVIVSALHESGPLATMGDVLKSAGKAASARSGYSMKVDSVEEVENSKGEVKVSASVTLPLSNDPDVAGLRNVLRGGNMRLNGNVNINGMNLNGGGDGVPPQLRLFDEKGREWKLVSISDLKQKPGKERRDYSLTLRFSPPQAGAKAAKLSLYATEPAAVAVPFTLKDVPLK